MPLWFGGTGKTPIFGKKEIRTQKLIGRSLNQE